ncbi:MAG: RNA methyltransferase [Patescibacteria group bacterium]|jgi:tRNA G18 (ribose-2'-O)-methylase SpoU
MPSKQIELVLVLPNIRSRFNVGSIFRTADGAGVNKIYLCGITPTPPHDKIAKVALGAETTVPWEYARQTAQLLKRLKNASYHIVALEQSAHSILYTSFRPKGKIALVLGNEVTGLPKQWLSLCDTVIDIPMRGRKESLNVSVAAGVAIFHILK